MMNRPMGPFPRTIVGYARFLGTCLGAVAAILAWNITAGNVFALAFLGFEAPIVIEQTSM
jgi:hypothetical protein